MGYLSISFAEVGRTTQLIGELIALITEEEETVTYLGRQMYGLYLADRVYDEPTLELCRRVDGTRQLLEKKRVELEEALEQGFGITDDGPMGKVRKYVTHRLLSREMAQNQKLLSDDLDELGKRVRWLASNQPTILTARLLRLCAALIKIGRDIDWRWDELQERTRNNQKGPVFLFALNMFIVNFFKFTNHTWFRRWIRDWDTFQEKFTQRIHHQVQGDLQQAENENPDDPGAPPPPLTPAEARAASPDPFKPPVTAANPSRPYDIRASREASRKSAPSQDAATPLPSLSELRQQAVYRPDRKDADFYNRPADGDGGAFGPSALRPPPRQTSLRKPDPPPAKD